MSSSSSSSSSDPPGWNERFGQGRITRAASDPKFLDEIENLKKTKDRYKEEAQLARLANAELPENLVIQAAYEKLRANPEYRKVGRNPYLGYNVDAMKDLADVIGKHNTGIKFNPVFNSARAAEDWLDDQLDRAVRRGDRKAVERLQQWRITQEDMDRDPSTIPNVVVYSDYDNKRVKAIDGYSLAPRNKKEALRAQYDLYPTREMRREQMSDPEEKKKLKAYFRKYPNPDLWNEESYAKFTVQPTLFNRLKKDYLEGFLKAYGFTIRSQANPNGQITVAHYMTIAQKIMSEIMRVAYLIVIPRLDIAYDFKADEFKVKNKTHKKLLERRMAGNILKEDYTRITKIYAGTPDASEKLGLNIKLEQAICAIVRYLYLDDAFKGNVPGTNVPYSHVFEIVHQINRKSGFTELEIIDKKPVKTKEGAPPESYKYRIRDYMIKPKAKKEPTAATILPSGAFAPLPAPTRERLRYLPKPPSTTLRGFEPRLPAQLRSPLKFEEISMSSVPPRYTSPGPTGTPTPPPPSFDPSGFYDDDDDERDIESKKK
jgi:hypothetical protein